MLWLCWTRSPMGSGSWSLSLPFSRFPDWKQSHIKVLNSPSWPPHKPSSGSVNGRPLRPQRLLQVEWALCTACQNNFYTNLTHSVKHHLTTSFQKNPESILFSNEPVNEENASLFIWCTPKQLSHSRDFSALRDQKRFSIKWDLGNVRHHCLRTIQSSLFWIKSCSRLILTGQWIGNPWLEK